MTTNSESVFQARARYEAARYGADAWVFVRELLQNARDAGAGRVWFEVSTTGGLDRIVCRDDGCGMTFAHARKFLFTLYASSKRGGSRSAGRFGIGFWSILRFSPSAITVRSRSLDHTAWQVRLDGDLRVVQHEPARLDVGCEVVIEREASGEDIEALLRAAVLRDAPFLTRRGHGDRPIDVRINGERVRAVFDLPPPNLHFRRRGLRGVVGLGPEPRVEVFVHGLRVRDAANLDDLLLTGRRGRAPKPAGVSDGLAPQALMDSSGLTVLLARGDAREDRSLRRLVTAGHHEIRRLVRAELDRHARPSPPALLVEKVRDLWSASRSLVIGCVFVFVILGAFSGWRMIARGQDGLTDTGAAVAVGEGSSSQTGGRLPYADLGILYRGPAADVLGSDSPGVDLEYRPASERPFFAALLIIGIDPNGAPIYPVTGDTALADGPPCVDGCLEVEMTVAAGGGLLRLPVATGHTVDPDSVRLNGESLVLIAEVGGLPAVNLGRGRGGRLTYRSAAGVGVPNIAGERWPPLPAELSGLSTEIAGLSAEAGATAVSAWVRQRVVYDASPATAQRHSTEQLNGHDLFERSLLVGAGDCDVQNAMVAAVLERAGIASRLAVGWVGEAGRTQPGLHAWVEYLGADGRWRVVDASADSGSLRRVVPPRAKPPSRDGSRTLRDQKILLGLAAASLLAGLALWFWRRPAHRRFSPGAGDGMADLVRAAAVNPGSFGGIHALYHRRLVPLLGGRSISMARALALAGRGRLAVGGRECGLAVRAARRGTVIDRDSLVGAAAADALGAVDLDDWQRVVSRSEEDPVANRVGEVLTAAGETYRLRVARTEGEDVSVFDGARLGLSESERWMVFDRGSDLWQKVEALARRYPAAAALLLADWVSDRLGLPKTVEDTCLAELARAALMERDGVAW